MKVGVAIPCHIDDKPLLQDCLESVANLNPQAFLHLVDLNDGKRSLKLLRTALFDSLFDKGCDVVLNCDVDFWLFPQILQYVRHDCVVDFAQLERNFSDVPIMLLRLFYPQSWSGLYSLPKHEWERIKTSWDGTDTSVKQLCPNYVFVKRPMYYALRSSMGKPDDFDGKSLFRKVLWMAKRPHASLKVAYTGEAK